MSDTQQAPNAASDVEMSQYVADRQRVDEEKLKKDDEIIQQFGDYTYGWHDSDAAGEAAKRGIDEQVVRDISADKGEPQWMLDMRLRGFKAWAPHCRHRGRPPRSAARIHPGLWNKMGYPPGPAWPGCWYRKARIGG